VITRADIVERVAQWGLAEQVVEKDYVLGWLLWGISNHPVLGNQWIFKGGTCLKKCYIETYRFSEDLDFTVLTGGPFQPEDVEPHLLAVLATVHEESGVDFSVSAPRLELRPNGASTEGRVYYVGPRQTRTPASVKLDITGDEPVVRPPVLRQIAHPYPDAPSGYLGNARCYSFDELFAEKIRAMTQRARPRDLYDIIHLFRRNDLRMYPDDIREVLHEKCAAKGVDVPTASTFADSPRITELESQWDNMLGHQLPVLPPLQVFLDELPNLLGWIEGTVEFPVLEAMAFAADEDESWSPPPTVATWQFGVPLETVRFAAANHLCVDLTYNNYNRLIEPYSLRLTQAGNLVLHAIRVDNREHRSYRVDKIQALRATTQPFRPVYAVEFSSSGPLSALPQRQTISYPRPSLRRPRSGPVYVYQCTTCGKEFQHSRPGGRLRAHQTPYGSPCRGRSGRFVGRR